MKRFILLILTALLYSHYTGSYAQEIKQINLSDKIPIDPAVKIGKLNNGITYYIRKNVKPEKRAELRLAVDAGSVLENDDQLGLAHFTEHMGFNGTKNFKKQELVNYLESIGMKFGPEVNAYTGFDETVYMLQLPTDSIEIFEKGFQVLEDWAHNVSFEDVEIDKERGVIIEEWRLGRGASARIFDKQLPVIFKDSKYGKRNVIGKKELLETFKHETLRNFYKDWYRPDMMAVVAVGDFDIPTVEGYIKKYFSRIEPPAANKRERELSPVPDHKETLYAIASDKEAMYSIVSIYQMNPIHKEITIADFRQSLIENLYSGMLNKRLFELTQEADPPFAEAYTGKFDIVKTKSAYALQAVVKDNGFDRGLSSLLRESERIRQYGFTQSEFGRQKKDILRQMENQFNERGKSESRRFAQEYINNFLSQNTIPGIEYSFELTKKLLPDIKLEEINKLASELLKDENRVILIDSPEKEGLKIPTENELSSIFNSVKKEKVTPYIDNLSSEELLSSIPKGSEITNEKNISEIGVTELELSNGVKVFLKPTDFKNDEILIKGISRGGTSLASYDEYISATTASDLINESGIGNFNSVELQKLLAGKVLNVYPWISEINEGIDGSASPQDIETLFQMIYLYFTAPRKDSTAFKSLLTKMNIYYQNKSVDPNFAFSDTIQSTLSNYHPLLKPWTVETLKKIDLNNAYNFYKDRFADASDFAFFIVGNFDVENLKPVLRTYFGGLPSLKRMESFKDIGKRYPIGLISKEIRRGIEPKGKVQLNFTGDFKWNKQNYFNIDALTDIMDIKLREVIREDKSGTYGVGVWQSVRHYPKEDYNVTITFGCDPKRTEELINTVFSQIDSLKNFGIGEKYITKIKEQYIRSREVNLKRNNFWLNSLVDCYSNNIDFKDINEYPKFFDLLSSDSIQKAANEYLKKDNYIKFVLYPEK